METPQHYLNIVRRIKIKGYTLLKDDDYFFRWKKDDKKEYIRLTLINNIGIKLSYWNLELSFKPFKYKHNHRKDSNIKSLTFEGNDELLKFNEFIKMLNKIEVKDGKYKTAKSKLKKCEVKI